MAKVAGICPQIEQTNSDRAAGIGQLCCKVWVITYLIEPTLQVGVVSPRWSGALSACSIISTN